MCTTECALPDVGKGGRARLIRKGTVIAVPADAFHKDEQYFPDPFKFDPTRFSQENKAKRSPYAYMGFGNGPRSCIGMNEFMTNSIFFRNYVTLLISKFIYVL